MSQIHLHQLLELSVPERVRLVQALWNSIEETPESIPVSEAERSELDRRLAAYERDPRAGTPWSEVRARLLGGK